MTVARGADIRAAVKALVQGVDDDGVVHDYQRMASNWSDILDLMLVTVDGEKVYRGWDITIRSLDTVYMGRYQVRHPYAVRIRGFWSIDDDDGSEKKAFDVAEGLVLELEQHRDLGGALGNGQYDPDNWPGITTFEPGNFGGILCHYIQVDFTVYEDETLAS